MTPEESIAKLARLYNDLQHAQNPAWVRPTDDEICNVLKDVLETIDIDYIESMKARHKELNDRLDNIYSFVQDIQYYCREVEDELTEIESIW
jgi:hypothetical protein